MLIGQIFHHSFTKFHNGHKINGSWCNLCVLCWGFRVILWTVKMKGRVLSKRLT